MSICKFYNPYSGYYGNCNNYGWHNNGSWRCDNGDKSTCKFWTDKNMNDKLCIHLIGKQGCDKKYDSSCNGKWATYNCNCHENYEEGDQMTTIKATKCKHISDNGSCRNQCFYGAFKRNKIDIEHFDCPFVALWDIAKVVCCGYEAKQCRYTVLADNGDNVTRISGPFDSEEEANAYIKTHIKIGVIS